MQNLVLGLALALAGVFFNSIIEVSHSQARVIIKEKTKYYRVTGSNGVEIYKNMLKNGPDHDGNTRDVLASTSFKFDFKNDVFTVHKTMQTYKSRHNRKCHLYLSKVACL